MRMLGCGDVHVTSNVELRNNVRLLLNVELRNYVISRQIVERRVTSDCYLNIVVSIALFTHGKCGPAHINVDRSRFYFVFTQHSVWTCLYRHVSAPALRPAHISYCIYTPLLRALYIFAHYTHARGRTSDWCFSRQNVLECHT